LRHIFQECIAPKWLEIDQDDLQRKFLALNVDYTSLIRDPPGTRRPAHASVKNTF